jgi:LmbE family N-acetylglucosaminyl deacetylase
LSRQPFTIARLVNYDAESGLPRWRTRALIHFLPPLNPAVAPTFLVDISAQFTAKYEVISAYASQLHQPGSREPQTYLSAPDFLRQRRAADIHRGQPDWRCGRRKVSSPPRRCRWPTPSACF